MRSPHDFRHRPNEIHRFEELRAALDEEGCDLSHYVIQGVDVQLVDSFIGVDLEGAIFLGCVFRDRDQEHEVEALGAYVFPRIPGLPYDPWRTSLYSVEELLSGYEEGGYVNTLDFRVYTHFDRGRRHELGVPMLEALAQRIHDHAVDDALEELLAIKAGGHRGVVGVMGGHGTRRDDPWYREVARLTWLLSRTGYFVASGGGPGIMEAANLGAWLSNYRDIAVIDEAIAVLRQAPRFDGGQPEGTPAYLEAVRDYIRLARRVVARFGPCADDAVAARFDRERVEPGESLAVPTWFYGHEPSNLFSTYIAKYFANSIREDGLLAISHAGVVYAPGSAGTLQEVFMDLAQNHYATFEWRSPMVFLSEERFGPVVELIRAFVEEKGAQALYGDMIDVFETHEEAVGFIADRAPRRRIDVTPLYDLIEVGRAPDVE